MNPEDASSYLQHRYFKYDALSRLTYERQVEQNANSAFNVTDPLTGNSQWSRKITYDEAINGVSYPGLVTSMTDARGVRTEYNYDNLNRIYQVTYSDGTPSVHNYYDQSRTGYINKGKLTSVTTDAVAASGQMPAIPATSQVYDYDQMGRVTHQQQVVGSNTYTLSYGYNLGGQLTSQTYPSGRVVNYSFDDAARLASVTSGTQTYASQFDYSSPQGLLKAMTLGNGAIESYDYNNRLQVNSISLAKNGNIIQRYEYKYGKANADGSVDESKNNGQIGRIESFVGTQKQWQQRFAYDSIGRLSTASEYRGDNSQQSYLSNYQYDTFGNRYQSAASNSNSLPYAPVENNDIDQSTNRFTSSQITYDAAGNVLSDPRFTNQRYTYDANNRQRQVTTLLTDNKGNPFYPPTTSVYDGAGQRVAQLYNGNLNQLFVYDASGKLVAEYGQAPLHQETMISDDGGGTHYVFTDQQGSTRVVMDSQAMVAQRHDYQPFGGEIYSDIGMRGNQGYGAGDGVRQKYAGMEKDDASGLSHTLWRKYDSASGRWTTPDPYGGSMSLSDPQSFNRYTYVNNDPVNLVDPTGLMAGADQGFDGFGGWGGVSGFNDSHFGGLGIISAAMNRYQGPDKKEDSPYKGDEGDNSSLAEGKNGSDSQSADSGTDEAANHSQSQEELFGPNTTLVEIIIWTGTGKSPVTHFGHVSYIINGVSYSWQKFKGENGNETWYRRSPEDYIKEKIEAGSVGYGYVLNFGSREANQQFANALIHAYDKWPHKRYDFITNNCGGAFLRTINAMDLPETRGLTGKNWRIDPQGHQKFILNNLVRYIVQEKEYRKH